jgi:membrane protein
MFSPPRTVTRHPVYATGTTLVALAQAQQLPFLAAAIAYYAFVSIVPLLIVGVAVATALAGQTVATEVVTAVGTFLTPEATDLLEAALVDDTGRGSATAAGLAVLLWGGLRVFRALDSAFSRIYGVSAPAPLLAQLRDAVLVLGAVVAAIGATVGLAAVVPLADTPFAGLAGTAGLLVLLPIVFFPLYYVFPARRVTVRDALPGAVFAGVGWTLLGTVFGIYTTYAGGFQLYGVLGGVLLLLVWFYFGGLVVLLGVALNVVLGGSVRDRQLQQGALRETDQRATMSEADGPTDDESDADGSTDTASTDDGSGAGGSSDERGERSEQPGTGPRRDPARRADLATKDELNELRQEIDDFEEEIEGRTVHREELEDDLEQYVRRQVRRGHARGWGPYLVLLYGTVMTLGAFYFLGGGWAILAMLVVWLSTLGLYALMVLVGLASAAIGVPGRVVDRLRNLR